METPADEQGGIRVNVFLSRCGLASRRHADEIVAAGRVTISGTTALLGSRVDPAHDVVRVDGREIRPVVSKTALVLNKPAGYLVSRHDPHYTTTVYDLLPVGFAHLVPVGRLDLNTEGVLLMTDDGQLVERLTHPRYRVPRVYRATVKGHPDAEALALLRNDVEIEGGVTGPAEVRVFGHRRETAELELVLREGRKREVRLMCRAVGHEVLHLQRTEFAGIGVSDLAPGRWRVLSTAEIALLREQSESPSDRSD